MGNAIEDKVIDMKSTGNGSFDVLDKQTDGTETRKVPIRKIDFEKVPKPTELEPVSPAELQPENKAEVEEKLLAPEALIEYVHDLNKEKGGKLKLLEWDMKYPLPEDQLVKLLDGYQSVGSLSTEERQRILDLFKTTSKPVDEKSDESFISRLVIDKDGTASSVSPMSDIGGDRKIPGSLEVDTIPPIENIHYGLELLGVTDEEINKLTPEEARNLLRKKISEIPTVLIEKAKTFDELYRNLYTLDILGGVRGSERSFQSRDLIDIIDQVRKGTRPVTNITRSNGLRDKVMELLDLEEKLKESSGDSSRTDLDKDDIETVPEADNPVIQEQVEKNLENDEDKPEDSAANPMSRTALDIPIPNSLETGIPLFITSKLRSDLNVFGFTNEEIDKLKPEEAWNLLMGQINIEFLNNDLAEARSNYATKLVEWKNQVRQKKGKFARLISDLGFEKQMPQVEMPQELKDAEKAYIEAKKRKNETILKTSGFNQKGFPDETGIEEEFVAVSKENTEKLVKQAEEEYADLQKRIMESMPPLERGIVTKTFEKWAKLPMPARIALSTSIMTGVTFAFGGIAATGVATYAGYRALRSFGGAVASQGVGKYVEEKFKEKNKEGHSETLKEYGTNISLENFEQKERELMATFDKEQNILKRQRLYKAAAMVGTGIGTTVGLSAGQSALEHLHHSGSGGVGGRVAEVASEKPNLGVADNTPSGKHITTEVHITENAGPKANMTVETMSPADVPTEPMEIPHELNPTNLMETKVELSSRGFIQTFEDLKNKLTEQYGGADKVPTQYEHFIKTPSTKLAEDFGFYDPEKHLSGMGLKGESLEFDQSGNLVYEHLDHSKDVLFDSHTGLAEKFHGNMFDPDAPKASVHEVASNDAETSVPDSSTTPETVTPELTAEPVEIKIPDDNFDLSQINTPFGSSLSQIESANHIPHMGSYVDVLDKGQGRIFSFNNLDIAHQNVVNGQNIMQLEDKFQNGSQWKEVRAAFTTAFDKSIAKENLGGQVYPLSFDGGKIHVIQGINSNPNEVQVLLNGKEIAKGLITEKGPQVSVFKDLKSSWFLADTVYERAFKQAKSIIKTLKINK